MAKRFSQIVLLAAFCLVFANVALAQVSGTGTLTGTVSDATGAVIGGADIKIKDDATGFELTTKSGADGSFTVASLSPGTYTVTVTMSGFKKAEYRAVKVTTGQTYDLSAKMEVGQVESTVVVEAGAEVLETAQTSIGTTITGRAINTLPLSSRDALDLAILMPGAATTGRVRQTSFMGLPKGAINITYDGINAQDNILKSSDGFFTIIRPKVDTVEEFSISTAGQTGDKASEGAVQINFETKRGGNQYHGGVWWQHRNDYFNSNYFFSNLAGNDRQRQRLNQFGGKVGGPIFKEKLFFFADIDNYRNPNSQIRSRTILAPGSLAGNFEYAVTAIPGTLPAWVTCQASSARNAGGPTCTANLTAMGAAAGFPLVADPIVSGILSAVDTARTATGVKLAPIPAPHVDSISFNNPGDATRRFPDLRVDWNITKNHQLTGIGHYNYFTSTPDFLNGFDQTFPVAPFNTNQGSQISNRTELVAAWRWNLKANMSNEVRFGFQSAPVSFFPDLNFGLYPTANTNQGTISIRPTFPLISNPFLNFSLQGRNTPVAQLIETFSWTRGKHSFTFGGSWTEARVNSWFNTATHTAALGLSADDPAAAMFTSANLPGSIATQRGNAGGLYALLTGRVSDYAGDVFVDENARSYIAGANGRQRADQTEFGFYAQDSWRILPTLTINGGVRWEYQGAPKDPKNISYQLAGGFAGVFGVSGLNNLFQPGTLTGSIPQYVLNGDNAWYNKDLNNWAPNLGLAWTPSVDNKIYNWIFGGPSKTVFRASAAITFTREGLNNFFSIAHSNPGEGGSIFSNAIDPGGPCPAPPFASAGSYPAGCLTLNGLTAGGNLQSLVTDPPAFPGNTPFNITAFAGQSVNTFDTNLGVPKVYNWTFGIQREISPSMVFEVRYVGNHGSGLWRQDNLNEINIFENGFLQEFLNAKNNLAICRATAGCTVRFSNQGLAGQVNVPIFTGAFTGDAAAGSQTNANFSSATFITPLDNNTVGNAASTLAASQTFLCNLVGTTALPGVGCPGSALPGGAGNFAVNFWRANPHATSGAFRMYNGANSTYNALQLEFRRRPSRGLQFNANYSYSHSISDLFADSSVSFAGFSSLRNKDRDKGGSPWDLRHQFKMQLIYDMPFGPGKKWSSSHGWMNRIIEQWSVSAINRWQSGRIFQLQSGNGSTFNNFDPGVELIGITPQQLQSMLSIRKEPNGQIFYFPASLISGGRANTAFIRPCGLNTVAEAGTQCKRLFFYGPSFYRADISIIKGFRLTERFSLEYRAEFLNAFNNINFFFPGSETTSVPTVTATSSTFGRVTNAYRDVSTTDDNGGRIIQMVLRVNF